MPFKQLDIGLVNKIVPQVLYLDEANIMYYMLQKKNCYLLAERVHV